MTSVNPPTPARREPAHTPLAGTLSWERHLNAPKCHAQRLGAAPQRPEVPCTTLGSGTSTPPSAMQKAWDAHFCAPARA